MNIKLDIEDVFNTFGGVDGILRELIEYCERKNSLPDLCERIGERQNEDTAHVLRKALEEIKNLRKGV